MFKSFYWTRSWIPWAWGGGLLLLLSVYAQVHLTVEFNEWYGRFYDLLQTSKLGTSLGKKGLDEFYGHLKFFCLLAMPYILIASFANFFTRVYALKWREAMTFFYTPQWLDTTVDIEGASQRIQEDCAKWAEIIQGLGLQAVRAILTLVAFVPVLWKLSAHITVSIMPSFLQQGNLVWIALIVSVGGMLISWYVGYWLPGLEYRNQKTEAAFRKPLVHLEDTPRNKNYLAELVSLFTGVKLNHIRLYKHYGYFDLWVNMFDLFMTICPYLVAGKFLLTGVLSYGALIQISNAFTKVQSSLSLFINNWPVITSARSVYKRLTEFEGAIFNVKEKEEETEQV